MSAIDWSVQSPTTTQAARVDSRNSYVSTDEFLKLLITQMTNQDPMNPMEDIDFTGQLASLQALDEQIKTNDVMTAMRVDTQVANVTGMIGKLVSGVDEFGSAVSGVIREASVESDVVYAVLANGSRIPADNVGKVWNQDNFTGDLAGAQATIGMLVGGKNADGNYIAGVVEAVSLDSNGNISLVLHDGNLLSYANVTEISTWYVDDGSGQSYDLATIQAMVGMYVAGESEGGMAVGKVASFSVDAEGKVWLEFEDGNRIDPANVERFSSREFSLDDLDTDEGDGGDDDGGEVIED